MNNIFEVCPANSAYKFRPETDVLFKMPDGSMKYTGIIDYTIKFIQSIQSKRTDLWQAFVRQFKAEPDSDLMWRGEYWGKMMRGACFTYQYTKDEELYDILTDTVRDLITAKDPLGRISTYSLKTEFDAWDLWCRKYVLLGFQYFLDICRDDALREEIIATMCDHADYIMSKVGDEKDGKKNINTCTRNWLGLNSSSILEPYVRLYNLTNEQKYLDYAKYIVDNGGISTGDIFELAYEDKLNPYEYPTTKAYEMMSCFEGLLEYYRVTKIEKYKEAVVRFARRVIKSDLTLIGCSGCTHEIFDFSSKAQTATNLYDVMQETCVTVTWMKLCYQVLSVTGDREFADAIEISTYNAMLGSINSGNLPILNGFAFDSYAPLYMGTRSRKSGGFVNMDDEIPYYGCCACIGSAGTALMALSSVMQAKSGIYMNLYVPGKISAKTPAGAAFDIKVDTKYPFDSKIDIFVQGAKGDEEFTLTFRIPAWCENPSMTVCGEKIDVISGTYQGITRKWNCCDKITLDFEMKMKAVLPPFGGNDENSKHLIALQKGPVVYARDARLGTKIDSVVDIAYDESMVVDAKEAKAGFDALACYEIPCKDSTSFKVVDFSSAGKTWDEESIMTVWMATKNFWKVDFEKSVKFRNNVFRFGCFDGEGALHHASEGKDDLTFVFEKIDDNSFYIKSGDKYLTAEKCDLLPERYHLALRDKGKEKQVWTLRQMAVNKYRIINKDLGLAFTHAFAGADRFILASFDTKDNDRVNGYSYLNNSYVDIINV